MTTTTALYPVAEIRAIERAAMAGLPPGTLMQRAGQAAAQAALDLIPAPKNGASVLIIAGPGNNGGDALEAATHLAETGVAVSVLCYADPGKQAADARQAFARAKSSNVRFLDPQLVPDVESTPWALVIDGLFGIGLGRPITGTHRALIDLVNRLACPVLALDVPSGLDADTGNIIGQHGTAIHATHTITFVADKPGLHTANGRDCAGTVQIVDLEIQETLFPAPRARLNHIELFAHALVPRLHNSHKGSHGDVAVIGGDIGMAGAAILAARAAAKCGAGRVYAGFVAQAPAYDAGQPELMCRVAGTLDFSNAAVVIGPGLGVSRTAHDLVARAINAPCSLVIDADALNLIASEPGLQHKLAQRRGDTVLTPHPLEAARLLTVSSADIQADRIAAARELSRRLNALVVLKGSGSIIAQPDGSIVVNRTGNPALATAGTGDVLAGICGALLAQHIPAWEAALCAVWLHGKAADLMVEQGSGPVGITADELIPFARTILNQLINDHAPFRGTR